MKPLDLPESDRLVVARHPGGRRACARRLTASIILSLLYGGGILGSLAQVDEAGLASPPLTGEISSTELEKTWGVGPWIWDVETSDKQTCHLWRSFEIPAGVKVTAADLRLSVDNGYRLKLDGRELGVGSDWRSITEYDVSLLLKPGRHVVAVEAFNDNREAGLQFGLKISLSVGQPIRILSDTNWRIAPPDEAGWQTRLEAPGYWKRAVVVGSMLLRKNGLWAQRVPTMIVKVPLLRPEQLKFWQRGWFQIALFSIATGAVLMCLRLMAQVTMQTKAQALLNRERARIARDIHDELGSTLTQLVLQGEVALSGLPAGSAAREQCNQLAEQARGAARALDEVVWAVNSRRDTVRDFASHLCKYAQTFLEITPIRCRLDVPAELPEQAFDLPVRRGLFLAVKEALNNAAKHSQATELFVRLKFEGEQVEVVVEDNGNGFDPTVAKLERNGLNNMAQRVRELGGEFRLSSKPGKGCHVEFSMPVIYSANDQKSLWKKLWRSKGNQPILTAKPI